MLFRLLYKSVNTIPEARFEQELEAISWACERNNASDNVTGALLAQDGWFVQSLEGGRAAVSRVLGRLIHDPRHRDLEVLAAGPALKREFTQFSMMICQTDDWMAAELANYSVGDRLDLNVLSADSLASLLVAIGNAHSQRLKEEIAALAPAL